MAHFLRPYRRVRCARSATRAEEQGREPWQRYEHIGVTQSGMIATIEVRRGPNNFVDTDMVAEIADVLEGFDRTPEVRAIVLCSEGKHFCAGADFGSRGADGVNRGTKRGRHLYKEAQRLWRTGKPIVAAVHGAAVGAGVGLAVMADFRVTCPEARFSVNFTRLGFHPGFGLTASLPRLIGAQQAALLMYTGRRHHRRAGTGDRPGGLLRAAGSGAATGYGAGDRDRAVGAAGDRGDAGNSAPRAGRGGGIGDRARIRGAGLAAQHRGFPRRGQGDGRAPAAGFQGALGHTDAVVTLPRTPSLRLDGRRALVTGAGRGIGLASAAALAQAGAHVVLVARTAAEIEAASAQILDEGGSAEPLVLDVTELDSVRAAIDGLAPFDVLVNNAGTNRPAPFLEVTEQDYDTITGLNQRAAFFVAQAVARRMVQASVRGSIVHISSQMGHVGGARRTVYCMSKHGIEGLTKAMAIDLAPHGIRVNTIGPTFIDTPLTRPFWNDKAFHADVVRRIKLGRLGTVEDLMGAVVFLASDAAALMTGTSLVVDGGWTAE